MRKIFKQIKKNKTKTALLVIVTFIMTFAVSSTFSSAFIGGGMQSNMRGEKPSFSQNQQNDAENSNNSEIFDNSGSENSTENSKSSNSLTTTATDSTEDNSSATDNNQSFGAMPSDRGNMRKGNQNTTLSYILVATAAVGAILIVVIATTDARKRRKHLSLLPDGTVDAKALAKMKKSAVKELIITVMITAIISSAAGLIALKPIQNAVMTDARENMQEMLGDNTQGSGNGAFDNNKMFPNTNSDGSNNNSENSENNSNNTENNANDENSSENNRNTVLNEQIENGNMKSTTSVTSYIYSAAVSLIIAVLASLFASLSICAVLSQKVDDDDEEDDEDNDDDNEEEDDE